MDTQWLLSISPGAFSVDLAMFYPVIDSDDAGTFAFIGEIYFHTHFTGIWRASWWAVEVKYEVINRVSSLVCRFQKKYGTVDTLGGMYLIGQVLIIGVFMMIGGSSLVDMLLYGKRFDERELMEVMDNALSALRPACC